MTIAYFDCGSGVAGDMVLGALIDAGMPLAHLTAQLKRLQIGAYEIRAVRKKQGIRGTNVSVRAGAAAHHADYRSLDRRLRTCRLSKPIREIARAIFATLARAEGAVHGVAVDRVHFHEVGAIDSLVDIVGAAIGVEYFGFADICSSPLPMARGHVRCAHGVLPVPAPATLEILKGLPLEPTSIREEIVTPTGAAILATLASRFGECPLQTVERVGYGFGDKVIPGHCNALRIMIGEGFPAVHIETDIDDMNPQLFEGASERCFAVGAVDVHLEALQMKKGRPGVKLVAIAPWEAKDRVIDAILRETTTFGVRYWPVERRILTRELIQRKTKRGTFTFKVGRDASGRIVKVVPEYESVKRLARSQQRPLVEVHQEAFSEAERFRRR